MIWDDLSYRAVMTWCGLSFRIVMTWNYLSYRAVMTWDDLSVSHASILLIMHLNPIFQRIFPTLYSIYFYNSGKKKNVATISPTMSETCETVKLVTRSVYLIQSAVWRAQRWQYYDERPPSEVFWSLSSVSRDSLGHFSRLHTSLLFLQSSDWYQSIVGLKSRLLRITFGTTSLIARTAAVFLRKSWPPIAIIGII